MGLWAGYIRPLIIRYKKNGQGAEEALKKANEELEARVGERTQVLWKMNEDLQAEIEERIKAEVKQQEAEKQRKELEAELRQAQKMESIGRLAGGIAHDFNNLLTVITGYAQLRLNAMAENDSWRADLEEIEKAAKRASDLTKQLLTFSRQQTVKLRVVSLDDVIINLDKMLRRLVGEEIEFMTLPGARLGNIRVDLGQMEQVLMNLVVNARDAIVGNGKIIIETKNVSLDEEYTSRHVGVTAGEYVIMAVSDTGCGMTPEVREHIFEPFFTTKECGKGTGLGLSTCYGIVKQAGGYIEVYSEPGYGSAFKVYLPRVEIPAETLSRGNGGGSPVKGTETVLLVEDQEMVRNLAARLLREQGYTVLEAVDGEAALRLVQENGGEKINLLLTDAVMPKLGGKELNEKIKALFPRIRTIFISGYTDNAMVQQGMIDPGTAFVQKPFSPQALLSKVRQVLDKV